MSTNQTLDWGKLVSQGRAKAQGVSWSDEEIKALGSICKKTGKLMSEIAPYIREGILTIEDYTKAQNKPGVVNPFLKLSKDALLQKAQALKLAVSPDATKESLADILLDYKKKGVEKAKGEEPKAPTKPEEKKPEVPEVPEKPKEPAKKPVTKPKPKTNKKK